MIFGKRARKTRESKLRARRPVTTLTHLFHGIAVRPGSQYECESVQQIGDHRFLSDEAPRLPLAGCAHPERCRCVYRHFFDRRTATRRESDVGLPTRTYMAEKRDGPGRRITDR